jgi:hypothetical protein
MALVESRKSTERLRDLLRDSKSCGLALAPLISLPLAPREPSLSPHTHSLSLSCKRLIFSFSSRSPLGHPVVWVCARVPCLCRAPHEKGNRLARCRAKGQKAIQKWRK